MPPPPKMQGVPLSAGTHDLQSTMGTFELTSSSVQGFDSRNPDDSFSGEGVDLLHQLEDILECDPLIDELGFIHPSQILSLSEAADSSNGSSKASASQLEMSTSNSREPLLDGSNHEELHFWNRDHKLGIVTEILPRLYVAAKYIFMNAYKEYKAHRNLSDDTFPIFPSSYDHLEIEVMIHSRSLLLLSCDFSTAWNSRRLVLSKKQELSLYVNELNLSALVLSYSPKSEQAWNHRRWVIKSIYGRYSDFEEILHKESELVERIVEMSKMNYRAWKHRCWLISYMTNEQVLNEFEKSRYWAGLHVADSCCFHYRAQLLLSILWNPSCTLKTVSSCFDVKLYSIWKEELDWNESLVKRYIGREALWLHRRFLSLCLIKHLRTNLIDPSPGSEDKSVIFNDFSTFLDSELCLVDICSTVGDNSFEDSQDQALYAASYAMWLKMHIPKSEKVGFLEKLKVEDVRDLLLEICPDRTLLWNYLSR